MRAWLRTLQGFVSGLIVVITKAVADFFANQPVDAGDSGLVGLLSMIAAILAGWAVRKWGPQP